MQQNNDKFLEHPGDIDDETCWECVVGSGGREGLRMRPRWQALAPGETVGPSTEIEDEI